MIPFARSVLTAPLGKTHIFALGQAGYIIKSSNGKLIGIDLYLSDAVERVEKSSGFKRLLAKVLSPTDLELDYIVCTHSHVDHFDIDSIPALMGNGKTKLACSLKCNQWIERLMLNCYEGRIRYVRPGDVEELEDLSISFVSCDHGIAAPDAVGVVVHVDGKIIYETGDTCLRMDCLEEIPNNLDVLIAPINGTFGNMSEADAVELAQVLQPRVTIPCHYGMFASHHGDVGKFYEMMVEKQMPFLLMQQGEKYTLE